MGGYRRWKEVPNLHVLMSMSDHLLLFLSFLMHSDTSRNVCVHMLGLPAFTKTCT